MNLGRKGAPVLALPKELYQIRKEQSCDPLSLQKTGLELSASPPGGFLFEKVAGEELREPRNSDKDLSCYRANKPRNLPKPTRTGRKFAGLFAQPPKINTPTHLPTRSLACSPAEWGPTPRTIPAEMLPCSHAASSIPSSLASSFTASPTLLKLISPPAAR